MTRLPRDESRIERARRGFEAADRYFPSETVRASSANERANTRIGLIGSFAVGLSGLALLPWQRFH